MELEYNGSLGSRQCSKALPMSASIYSDDMQGESRGNAALVQLSSYRTK